MVIGFITRILVSSVCLVRTCAAGCVTGFFIWCNPQLVKDTNFFKVIVTF